MPRGADELGLPEMSQSRRERPHPCLGWRIVCPDGRVRHAPYHNEGDARCDARHDTKHGHKFYEDNPPEWYDPSCSGGAHTVEPVSWAHP